MNIHWIPLESPEQLQQIQEESTSQPVIIFKHSTRCSVSSTVLGRIERSAGTFKDARLYFLDLLSNRSISNMVEDLFSVQHESPQLLMIRDGVAVFHASHFEIEPGAISTKLSRS